MVRPFALVVLALLLPLTVAAQVPRFSNARVETRPVTGTLEATIRGVVGGRAEPLWIGYAVPVVPGDRQMCCWNGDGSGNACCNGCRLEPGASNAVSLSAPTAPGPVLLEAGESLFVLARYEQSAVTRIRMFSESCPLDAGDRAVVWLTGVAPADSAAWLATFLTEGTAKRVADSALSALAMHREPSALDRLIGVARQGATTHIRGQALFWLAQRAGDKAVGAISEVIARDPETEVKRRAVFALSQLPANEGVPMMIQVARTHANPAVRKQAMFWLGQSKDPRALRFFEEILFK
jgi:hypothetical protein